MYNAFLKRLIDIILSLCGIIVLSPVFLIIAAAIIIDDPGPIFFKQKRVGKNKKLFKILKFRSMKMSTPHDTPTHMLQSPEQYITRVGKFLRKTSLDELPQIAQIFTGKMAIIGPRPALWNQYDLIAEREKYGANDIRPGLTGWAQINGRDELKIPVKARLDGEYVKRMSFLVDCRCFLGTIFTVLKSDGVVEGGTGEMRKEESDKAKMKQILVSVVVATYRRDESLKKALRSLYQQTYPAIEIILVDDNADISWNEKVVEIIDEFRSTNSEISFRHIVNYENQGSANTRNIGIQAANGQYITFLDDDDLYLPEKINRQVRSMIQAQSDFSLTNLFLYNKNDKLIDRRIRDYIQNTDQSSLLQYHLMYHMTGTDSMMFKKTYIKKIGGFPPIDVGDEFYLMCEAIAGGGKFSCLDVCDIKAYIHTGEGGLSSGETKINGENQLYAYKKALFNQIDAKTRRYIRMRHHAVLAFSHIRQKRYPVFAVEAAKSFFSAPVFCFRLLCKGR